MKRKVVYETALVVNDNHLVFMKEINEYYTRWQNQEYEINIHFSTNYGSFCALLEKVGYKEQFK